MLLDSGLVADWYLSVDEGLRLGLTVESPNDIIGGVYHEAPVILAVLPSGQDDVALDDLAGVVSHLALQCRSPSSRTSGVVGSFVNGIHFLVAVPSGPDLSFCAKDLLIAANPLWHEPNTRRANRPRSLGSDKQMFGLEQ